MGKLFTIGHSTNTINDFVNLLKTHNVNYLLDVRSTPYSRYASQFNREILSLQLKSHNITYGWMGKFFGARQEDKSLYNKDGYLDFDIMRSSDIFKKGYENVILGLNKGNNIALMCAEKDPIDCHRTIMVSRAFELNKINVNHILQDGSLESQAEVSKRLTDLYFPDRNEYNIFDFLRETDDYLKKDNIPERYGSEEEYTIAAYKKQNQKIGFRFENLTMDPNDENQPA